MCSVPQNAAEYRAPKREQVTSSGVINTHFGRTPEEIAEANADHRAAFDEANSTSQDRTGAYGTRAGLNLMGVNIPAARAGVLGNLQNNPPRRVGAQVMTGPYGSTMRFATARATQTNFTRAITGMITNNNFRG